jgi:hypothetical protein
VIETEHLLAGVDVTQSTLADALRAFGAPTSRDTHDLVNVDAHGAFTLAHTTWGLGDVTVHAVTRVSLQDAAESVVGLRVAGKGLGFQTGAGVQAGDIVSSVLERYGLPGRTDPLCYDFTDGGSLIIRVESDHVVELQLMSPWLASMCREGPEDDEAVEQGDEADER